MNILASTLLALTLAFPASAHAQKAPTTPDLPPAASQKAEPDEAALQTHNHYRNKAGQDVHSPAKSIDGKVPAGASAKCRDDTYSFSKNRRGACSGHGGVAAWL